MANFARGLIGGYALGTDIGERLGERRREKAYSETMAPFTPEEVYGQVSYEAIPGMGEGLQAPESRYLDKPMSDEEWAAYAQQRETEGYRATRTGESGWRTPYSGKVYESQYEAYQPYEKERLAAQLRFAKEFGDRKAEENIMGRMRELQQYEDQQARYKDQENRANWEFERKKEIADREDADYKVKELLTGADVYFQTNDLPGLVAYYDANFPGEAELITYEDGTFSVTMNGNEVVERGDPLTVMRQIRATIGGPEAQEALRSAFIAKKEKEVAARRQDYEDNMAMIKNEIELAEKQLDRDPDNEGLEERLKQLLQRAADIQQNYQTEFYAQSPELAAQNQASAQRKQILDEGVSLALSDPNQPIEDLQELQQSLVNADRESDATKIGRIIRNRQKGLTTTGEIAYPEGAVDPEASWWTQMRQKGQARSNVIIPLQMVVSDLRSKAQSPFWGAFTDKPTLREREYRGSIADWVEENSSMFVTYPELLPELQENPEAFYEKYKDGVPGMKRGGLVRKYKDGGKVEEKEKKEKPTTEQYKIYEKIDKYASEYGVDPAFMRAVVRAESNFDPKATSPVGAMGLGQLMPGTAKDMGVKDPYDVDQNLRGTAKYLGWLQGRHGSVDEVLAAYNYGTGNVNKRGVDWIKQNIPETRDYIAKVKKYYGQPQADFGGQATAPRGGIPSYVRGEGAPDRAPLTYEDFETRRRPGLRRPIQMPQAGPVAARPQMYSFDNPNTPPDFYPVVNMSEGGSTTGLMDRMRNWRKSRDAKLKEDAPGALGRAGLSRGDMAAFGERLNEALTASPRPYEADMPYQPIGDSLEMLMQRRMQAPDLSQYYAYGGQVRDYRKGGDVNGPGTSTSDSIPAMLSDGEYVINAKAVKMIGEDVLDKINALGLRKRGR